MKASLIIRTYNEERYLPQLLDRVSSQRSGGLDSEVIVVDSGSNDSTVSIAKSYGCLVVPIDPEQFSFGRSLNLGCSRASGDFLVFVSGHCIPASEVWLQNLVKPLKEEKAVYSYGKQVGGPATKFSEEQVFRQFYSTVSQVPQAGFFCNNANAALLAQVWEKYRFDENLTGLEDMHLGKRLVQEGKSLAYVADAPVYHLHHETLPMIRRRFEREAIALREIMPEVHVGFFDFFRYYLSAVLLDVSTAVSEKKFFRNLGSILLYRWMQYWGTFRGNHEHRKLSKKMKDKYFYPKRAIGKDKESYEFALPFPGSRPLTHEG